MKYVPKKHADLCRYKIIRTWPSPLSSQSFIVILFPTHFFSLISYSKDVLLINRSSSLCIVIKLFLIVAYDQNSSVGSKSSRISAQINTGARYERRFWKFHYIQELHRGQTPCCNPVLNNTQHSCKC